MSFILSCFHTATERKNKKQMNDDITKPWEAMYRALLKRLTVFFYPTEKDPYINESTLKFSLKEIVDIHNKLLAEYDNNDTSTDK
tara:strand:- start:1863 stop:2117 length:255 start_codon:yes stop_codon:yes gene_type:complete